MCGIAGILSKNSMHISPQRLQKMTDSIAHRGPDGAGAWINTNHQIGLAHRRLSIIDLGEQAAQPMHGNKIGQSQTNYTITYNGEIYNYIEVRAELILKGYIFKTSSDTEVILAAYDYWKTECLQQFDGMFAFAIWDEERQQLFCARDRFGEKPFYFFQDNEQLLFASEMKALWATGVPKEINNKRLINYIGSGITYNATQPAETFFKGIYALPPSHYMLVHLQSMEVAITSYWDIDKENINTIITEQAAIETFYGLLEQSVKRRLRSDVALGTSLSGGLDSSSIVAMIKSLQPNSTVLKTFSAVFPAFEKDESKYIKEVVHKYDVENFTISPSANKLVTDFEKLFYHQEEPFQSFSIYTQYKVYELAKQHGVTVILDGQGADETLAGYHKYYNWYWQELFGSKQFSLGSKEVKDAQTLGIKQPWDWKNKAAAFMPETAAKQLEKRTRNQQNMHPFLAADFLSNFTDTSTIVKPIIRKLNDILYFDTMQSGLQELLRYADRNSMAHGREVRLPFLSHELVQFIFSLPSHFKIKQGWSKWVLRKSMDSFLPTNITWRKDKVGYEPPQQQWLQHPALQEKIKDSRKTLVEHKILKPSILEQPIEAKAAHEAGNDDFHYLCVAELLNG